MMTAHKPMMSHYRSVERVHGQSPLSRGIRGIIAGAIDGDLTYGVRLSGEVDFGIRWSFLGAREPCWRGTWCGGGSAAFHTHSNETFRQIACDQCLSPSRIDGNTERTISRVMRNLLGL